MIDRYTIIASPTTLKSAFGFIESVAEYSSQYNAAPTKQLPVSLIHDPGTVQLLQWGFISSLSNNKKMSPRLFNTDIVQGISKPSIKKSIAKKRCIIYADGFFVWKLVSKKTLTPHYVHARNDRPLAIGGFWEEKDEFVENSQDSFMMLTRPAVQNLAEYQEDMPFIIPDKKIEEWLNVDLEVNEILGWMEFEDQTSLSIYPVSPAIIQTNLNDERLIERTLPADQHGNYTLFG